MQNIRNELKEKHLAIQERERLNNHAELFLNIS